MQYLSPDPIGLAGGVRPQGYVADPNGWVDPLGLAGCGAAIPKYGTPFQPLTPAQRVALQQWVNSRTATRNDYNHLQWGRRFSNRRNRGVNRFWNQERTTLLAGGSGSRNLTPAQRADILAKRRPSFGGEAIEGHHMHNALDHPHIADNPDNIYPATRNEHFNRWHGGSWKNNNTGRQTTLHIQRTSSVTNVAIKFAEDKFASASLPAKVLKDLAGYCGISLTKLKEDAGAGNPILNVELFMNDHVEIAQRIRSIMALDRENDLGLIYFEMQNQAIPDDSEKIDMEIMENTLREADGEFS